jgi:hypothetical protein
MRRSLPSQASARFSLALVWGGIALGGFAAIGSAQAKPASGGAGSPIPGVPGAPGGGLMPAGAGLGQGMPGLGKPAGVAPATGATHHPAGGTHTTEGNPTPGATGTPSSGGVSMPGLPKGMPGLPR